MLMRVLRTAGWWLALLVVTPPMALIAILSFPFAPRTRHRIISVWTHMMVWVIRNVLGIRDRVIGRENIPARASVALAKHQSAWETILLQVILPPQVFVLKRELLRLPFFGWGLAQMPMIAIDRNAGKDALSQVVEQGRDRLDMGLWVVVFPEGTRVPVGQSKRFKIGGAHLATATGAPVVPIAHNAGECWPRNAIMTQPGEIVVSIGPAIETAGRTALEVNEQAQAWIEAEMRRLFPHHYATS